jgi:hypothetical protein
MARSLQIHALHLSTASATSSYTFGPGVNAVVGSYKTGKSSMLELFKFALGGSGAKIMPTIAKTLQTTALDVSIGGMRLTLNRVVGQNVITVNGSDGVLEQWTATQGKLPRAGIRLLEMLNIPTVRLSKNSDAGSEALTFFDLYRSIYLPQSDVNSSVAGHLDQFLNRKRKAVFELVYGLADNKTRELEVTGAELSRAADRARVEADTVRRFLVDVGAPSEDQLTEEEEQIRQQFLEADSRLEAARASASGSVEGDQRSLRTRIAELRTMTADLESERAAAVTAVEVGRSLIAQLDVDEQRFHREIFATQSISGLEFSVCPRCLQNVEHRETELGHCLLCTQPQQPTSPKDADDVLRRLKAQREETQTLVLEDEQRLAFLTTRLHAARVGLDEAAGELERQADPDRLFPSIDLASTAASDREQARARLRDVERFRDLWSHHEQLELEVVRYQRRITENQEEQEKHRNELNEHRSRIADLGEIFDEEIRELRYTGYENAGIDATTYLPVINGDTFDKLSVSGASKTLANVAYYLANAAYSLSDAEFLIPDLLILDSPRTSLGNTADDIAAGQRIYYRMDVLALAYPNLQIIVADNGLPPLETAARRRLKLTELDYPRPLLQDVPHPGRRQAEAEEEAERPRATRRRTRV